MSGETQAARSERREQYELVLGIVDHNSGGKQPPMAALTSVRTIAGHADIDAEDVDKRIGGGVQHGELLREDGRVCLADAADMRKHIEETADVDHLRTLLNAEASGPCRKPLIGAINKRIVEVEDGE